MKKIFALTLLAILLAGCSDKGINDSYSAYRDKTAAQLYQTGTANLKKQNYDSAAKNLEALNALYPFGAYAEEGQVNLIYAYYMNDDNDEALAIADRYLRLYPQGKYADYVYYMKGVIATGRGFTWVQKKLGVDPSTRDLSTYKDGYLAFSSLVRYFPNSQYVPDALIRMRFIRNILAEHELHIAQFYYERKAYVAAANRAKAVVEHYDGAPAVIPALALLIKSYRMLGLPTMAANTYAILQASYPDSREYRQLIKP